MRSPEATAEARRSLEICNACRYCEGFCAVFPAMELRSSFGDGDLNYLANLCHNCRACYYACPYTSPHEFDLNVPRALAELRAETYEAYAWPEPMAALFRRNGTFVSVLSTVCMALALLLTSWLQSPAALSRHEAGPGAFYRVIPEGVMTSVALVTVLFSALALGISVARFWRDIGGGNAANVRTLGVALWDVLTLRNLGNDGLGCNDRGEGYSQARRRFHHAVFYGFLLCATSTTVAAVYDHLLGRAAPYPLLSLPVLLGTAGGIGMTVGAAGLLWLKRTGDPEPAAVRPLRGEYALLVLLLLVAASGLALLVLRDTPAMGILLAVHLGAVLSFFVTAPYSKFVHGIYRSAALLRSAHERRAISLAGADLRELRTTKSSSTSQRGQPRS
ncbi:MAG: tricarballylate utilization 4Fe-4S protein TcuB [Gemmatimonadales bacterium]